MQKLARRLGRTRHLRAYTSAEEAMLTAVASLDRQLVARQGAGPLFHYRGVDVRARGANRGVYTFSM